MTCPVLAGFAGSKSSPGSVEAVLGTVDPAGSWTPLEFQAAITENPQTGDTEVWEFHNFTADAHPIHIHEQFFQVVNRQALTFDEHTGVIPDHARLESTPS